jgi:hypothetical protein
LGPNQALYSKQNASIESYYIEKRHSQKCIEDAKRFVDVSIKS